MGQSEPKSLLTTLSPVRTWSTHTGVIHTGDVPCGEKHPLESSLFTVVLGTCGADGTGNI